MPERYSFVASARSFFTLSISAFISSEVEFFSSSLFTACSISECLMSYPVSPPFAFRPATEKKPSFPSLNTSSTSIPLRLAISLVSFDMPNSLAKSPYAPKPFTSRPFRARFQCVYCWLRYSISLRISSFRVFDGDFSSVPKSQSLYLDNSPVLSINMLK